MGYVKISDLQQKNTSSLNGSEDMLVTSENISYKLTVNSMSDYIKNKTIYDANSLYINTNIIKDSITPKTYVGGVRKDWVKSINGFTGYIAIEITGLYPQLNINGLMNVRMLEANNTKLARCLSISWQWNNSTSKWDYGYAVDTSSYSEMKIRFSRDAANSKVYVILGESNTVWSDTRISIEIPLSSYVSGLNLGFDIATLTTLSGITTDIYKNVDLKITKNPDIVPGTSTKITYDSKGLVVSGASLISSDIPNLDASKITSGTIDAARLPAYVDDVLEFANLASFPATGTSGKIYVALDTNKTYRWSGSVYVYITSGAVDSVNGQTGVVNITTITGNANTATTLQNARTIQTNLASVSSASFNGSANITPGVTGVLPVANGGTGSSAALVQGGIKYATSTTAEGTTAAGTAGQILVSGGTGAPTWVNNDLSAFPGSTFKKSARVATTAALTLNAATATIDGVTLTSTDRVLIKNQATASQNGIYTGVTTTTWVRATDADTSSEIASAIIAVDEGTTNGGRLFTNTFKATDVLGTTAMNWYEVMFNTGTWGISITGNAGTATTLQTARTIATSGDVVGTATSFNGSANITIPMTLANVGTAGTYTKVTTDAKGRITSGTTLSASDIPTLNQNTTGSAATLTTARTVQTNLGSTTSASFDGSANITPGVTGTLPVGNGGTGAITLTGLVKGNGTAAMSAAVAGTDYVVPSGSITGNAGTATTLQTARTINDVSFNGSSDILIGQLNGDNYISGGLEKPNNAIFGSGKFRYQMLRSSNLGTGRGVWNDVLWTSSYTGTDVKGSNALILGKDYDYIGFSRSNYDATSWTAPKEILHTGNYNSYVYTKTEIDNKLTYDITSAEFITDFKRGGTTVYGVEVNAGLLVNTGTKEVSFIFNSSYNYWLDNQNSYCYNTNESYPINYTGNIGESISCFLDKTNNKIKILCSNDKSTFTAKIILLYTK